MLLTKFFVGLLFLISLGAFVGNKIIKDETSNSENTFNDNPELSIID